MKMSTHYGKKLEFTVVLWFLLWPWQGPIPSRPYCGRNKSSIVRKVFAKRWMPIIEKVGVDLPLSCPLHPSRDLFTFQESGKVLEKDHQWKCSFCDQSFTQESNLDQHMDITHNDNLNEGEDTVCLADYCDVMRCEVLENRLDELDEISQSTNTIDIWHKSLLISSQKTKSSKAVERSLPRSIMESRVYLNNIWLKKAMKESTHNSPKTSKEDERSSEKSRHHSNGRRSNGHHSKPVVKDSSPSSTAAGQDRQEECIKKDGLCQEDNVIYNESDQVNAGPTELPIQPLHSWKDTCNEENLAEIRAKCQQLVQQCVAGLVVNLTLNQVKNVEDALYRTVCWYLTCQRYWDSDPIGPYEFPWGMLLTFILSLSLGISVCYYIVWILCGSTCESLSGTPVSSEQLLPSVLNQNKDFNLSSYLSSESSISHAQTTTGLTSTYAGGSMSRSVIPAQSQAARESESEFRDSGFNEGGIYPETDHPDTQSDGQCYRSRHYSEDSRFSFPPDDHRLQQTPNFYTHEERVYNYASSFTPNYEKRRLRRNRYNYLDDYDAYTSVQVNTIGDAACSRDSSLSRRDKNDCFIYVSYPPEIKKKFTDNNR